MFTCQALCQTSRVFKLRHSARKYTPCVPEASTLSLVTPLMTLPEIIDSPTPSSDDPHHIYHAPNLTDGRYFTPWSKSAKTPTSALLKWQLAGSPYKQEKKMRPPVLPVADKPLDMWQANQGDATVMWLGHATFFIELDGRRILIDPVLGDVNLLVKRQVALPLNPHDLPRVDVVLLTHGHYDHLNTKSLDMMACAWPECIFCVPMGQQRYLPASCRGRVVSVDWWQHVYIDHIKFTFLPSQHWHQRGLLDYNQALWGGWWMEGSHSIYHMGDSGYFEGFKAIFAHMNSPDIMMLPMGAYEPRWFMATQHMDPEQAYKAWEDLGATYTIPMHYGTFDLSDEPLDLGTREFREHVASQATPRVTLDEQFIELAQGASVGFAGKSRLG